MSCMQPIRTSTLRIDVHPDLLVAPPIYFGILTGSAGVHERITSGQARELAARLTAVADVVESGSEYGSPSFDEVVDTKMRALRFIEVSS
jgi:hypothetical protein